MESKLEIKNEVLNPQRNFFFNDDQLALNNSTDASIETFISKSECILIIKKVIQIQAFSCLQNDLHCSWLAQSWSPSGDILGDVPQRSHIPTLSTLSQ